MRSTTSALDTAFGAGHVPFVLFVELQLASGPQRLTTAGHSLTWAGQEWMGFGALASVEKIREAETLEAIGVRLSLSSIPTSILSLALGEHVQGKVCLIWAGALVDGVVVVDSALEFVGRIDTLELAEDGKTGSVSVNVESRAADFARPRLRRYSDADQQQMYPGDLFFRYVAQMAEKQIIWPSKEYFQR